MLIYHKIEINGEKLISFVAKAKVLLKSKNKDLIRRKTLLMSLLIIKVIKKHVKINPCQSAEAFETMSLIEKIYQYAEK